MTTINTRTTGPQAWKIALVAVAASLATLVVVNLPISTDTVTGQPATVATQAVPDQATVDLLAPVITQDLIEGSSVGPQSVPDQATIDGVAPVITQDLIEGNAAVTGVEGGPRVDPRAAAGAGLNPGAVDEIVGGTTSSAVPDQATIDGVAPVISQESIDGLTPADGTADAATSARWQALATAYENGTISSYYLPAASGQAPNVPMANNQVR